MAYTSEVNHSIVLGSLSQSDGKKPTQNQTKHEHLPFKRKMHHLNWIMTWQYMPLLEKK